MRWTNNLTTDGTRERPGAAAPAAGRRDPALGLRAAGLRDEQSRHRRRARGAPRARRPHRGAERRQSRILVHAGLPGEGSALGQGDLRLRQRPAGGHHLVPRPRPGHHPPERVRGTGGLLHHPRRVRHGPGRQPGRSAGVIPTSGSWSSRTTCSTPTASTSIRRSRGIPAGTTSSAVNPLAPQPSALAEFFGDFILVNGVPWPKMEVEPRVYRLRLLNGSDSRVLQAVARRDRAVRRSP